MLRTLFISLLCLLGTTRAQAWGPKGHDVVAYIAECNLTPEAAEKIDKILGGASMVYWANWLASASHTPEYAYTATWHYANVDEGFTYETMTKNPDGDIVEAIDRIVAELKGGQLDPAQEQLYLKMLVHLVGDLHQPMHTGHLSDRGGNSVPVRFFGRESNLHAVWDSSLPEAAHKWSYTEWQNQLDRLTEEEVARIQSGTPLDWFEESNAICREIYVATPEGSDLSYDYIAKYAPVIERQLLRGGHRLAGLLNEIHG